MPTTEAGDKSVSEVRTGQLFVGCGTYIGDARSRWVPAESYEAVVRELQRLRLAPEPAGWQPIEAAPNDGTQVLMLYEPTREPGTMRRCVCQHHTAHGWFTVPGSFWLMPNELRGWLPLPSFPETKGGQHE